MKINFFGKSDSGKVRSTNEDYFSSKKISDSEHLFIVADGMGGHQAGEVASKLGTDTFVREYKKSRKQGKGIEKSMVSSLKKSNSSILKRALSDPMKRGMGTTFTALVIADKKATIIHVGDTRIYLIRKNKIKKMTTDHTFVEKMLKEGKISEEEARDHPQKNILYMSLGARETYSPEIIRDAEIKQGDIITMCSDGLNNMLDDQVIKKFSHTNDPKKSVNELIKRANENGGIDNITVQIIHAGETKKEKPKKRKIPTKKTAILFFFGFLIILFLSFSKLKIINTSSLPDNSIKYAALMIPQIQNQQNKKIRYNQNIFKINTRAIPSKLFSGHLLFFSGEHIFYRQQKHISVFSIIKQKIINKIQLKKEDAIIQTSFGFHSSHEEILLSGEKKSDSSRSSSVEVYIFQKSRTPFLKYQILHHNENKVLVTIRSDPELNSVDHEIRTVKFLNLKPPLAPIFINSNVLLFHDQQHVYVIENPIKKKNKEIKFYKINDIQYNPQLFVSLKISNKTIKVLFFNIQKKYIKIFDISKADFTSTRKILFEFTEKPLNIEYIDENSIIIYFSYGYITLEKNNAFIQKYYEYKNKNLFIQNILIDYGSNRRILVDKNNRLFILLL